jgi:hypothetical protein
MRASNCKKCVQKHVWSESVMIPSNSGLAFISHPQRVNAAAAFFTFHAARAVCSGNNKFRKPKASVCVCVSVAPPKKQHAKMRLFSSSSATQSWESVVFSFRSLCVRVSFIGASAGPFSLFRSHSFSLYFPKTATSRYTHWYMWIFASASRPFANIYTLEQTTPLCGPCFVVGGGERKRVRESYWDVTRPEIYV